jgi:hypothetical protein
MKITFTFIFSLLFANSVFSQTSTDEKKYKNELGADLTGFVRQFFSPSTDFYQDYIPVYYLTYRRHFSTFNLRSGFGFNSSNSEYASPYTIGPRIYNNQQTILDLRAGCEWVSELGKRWQAFYGIDFRYNYNYYKNDAPYFNGGYANGSESKINSVGIAPLLGFRFRINNRISLSTETSLGFNRALNTSRRYFTSLDTSLYPPLADITNPKTTNWFTNYSPPIALYLNFDL